MAKYIRKPQIVDAIQWKGNNINDIIEFLKNSNLLYEYITYKIFDDKEQDNIMSIKTNSYLVGHIFVSDYIIVDSNGKLYTLSEYKFNELYEDVKE